MEREILFRGQRKDNKQWALGDLLHKGGNRETCPNTGRDMYVSPYLAILTRMGDVCEIIPETIGQFTGLTDKNGVKIFEGDVVQYYVLRRYVQQSFPDIRPEIDELYLSKRKDIIVFRRGTFTINSGGDDFYETLLCDVGLGSISEIKDAIFGENRTKIYSEEEMETDCNGNEINESVLGIQIIGNIHENSNLIQ